MATTIPLPMVPARKPRPSRLPSKKALERAAEFELFGRQLFFRFNVIKARMQAHGINWTCWLGLKLLAHCGLETWLGTPDEEARLRRAAFDVPQKFIDAALANPFVMACRMVRGIRREPPIRLRFEEAAPPTGFSGSASALFGASLGGRSSASSRLSPTSPTPAIASSTAFTSAAGTTADSSSGSTLKSGWARGCDSWSAWPWREHRACS